ncbi:MAG: folate-binding protein YgfZ [Deltaproteobacteria bacterium]|nr:folate-binding protein YgfZ [Deltaproteobacteria bacterium]
MTELPLHALHQAEGAAFAERNGREVLVTQGASADAFWALKRTAALQDRTGRGLLKLTGPDREEFLHGQTTNDVEGLAVGHGNGAALLTARGKMLGEVRVLKRAEDLLVETELGFAGAVKQALERNCISEEVEFADLTADYGQLGLYGPEAHAILTAALDAPAPGVTEHEHQTIVLAGAEVIAIGAWGPGAPGYDLLVPVAALEHVWKALRAAGQAKNLVVLGEEAYELARVEAGLPRYGVDMTEETNPLEANLERDISYKKGCYVGQEVIAKATFRGHVNKKLARLSFAAELPAPGVELQLDGRVVGKVTSAAQLPDGRKLGLGYVKRDLAKAGVALTVAGGGVAETLGLAQPVELQRP